VVEVGWIGEHIERVVESRLTAAVLWRPGVFAGDIAWIGQVGVALSDGGDDQQVLPAVSEVIQVVDRGPARLEHVAQASLDRARRGSPPQSAPIGGP
jgi:hypothetical protein